MSTPMFTMSHRPRTYVLAAWDKVYARTCTYCMYTVLRCVSATIGHSTAGPAHFIISRQRPILVQYCSFITVHQHEISKATSASFQTKCAAFHFKADNSPFRHTESTRQGNIIICTQYRLANPTTIVNGDNNQGEWDRDMLLSH